MASQTKRFKQAMAYPRSQVSHVPHGRQWETLGNPCKPIPQIAEHRRWDRWHENPSEGATLKERLLAAMEN